MFHFCPRVDRLWSPRHFNNNSALRTRSRVSRELTGVVINFPRARVTILDLNAEHVRWERVDPCRERAARCETVFVARATRAVDPSSWQPCDESTLVQGGWTAAWRDRTEVSARADVKPYVHVLSVRNRSDVWLCPRRSYCRFRVLVFSVSLDERGP